MSDIVAAVCVLLFGFLGYRKGFVRSLAGAVSLVGGYAASVVLSRPFGDVLIAKGLLKGFLAYAAGGLLAFLGVLFLVRFLAWIAEGVLRRVRSDSLSRPEKAAGLAVGCAQGALIAVLLVWGITFVRGARAKLANKTDDLPEPTVSERAAKRAVAKLSELALRFSGKEDDPMARTIGAVVADPGSADRHLKKIMGNKSLSKALQGKDKEALKRLASDEDFVRSARELGIVREGADTEELGRQLSSAMGELSKRREGLASDPMLKTVLDDPKVRRMLESGLDP